MADTTTAELVARYLDLDAKRAAIVEEQDVIKAQLRTALPVGKHPTDTGTVTVSVNRRFDETTARGVLDETVIAAATRPKLDSSVVKKLVPPVTYEACMKESGDPKVSIQ